MENRLYSLSKIFTERIFRIPDYQRGYAWQEKQLREFWGDLMQLEVDKNHYIGVLTLEEVHEKDLKKWDDDLWIINSKSYIPYHVVDGQQRLTTAIVLIQCIIESIKPSQKLNYTSPGTIRNKFIFETKDEGISRSYLFGYEKFNPSYEFLKTKIFMEKSDDAVLHETIYTSNLELAKEFFTDKLKNLTFREIEGIYKKLTQHFLFNIYAISSDIDVHVTFETMNNRGKPLSHLELLKNRLIYLSTKFSADESDKKKLRSAINECWKTIYHFLGKNKQNPLDDDTFLRTHFNIYHRREYETIMEQYRCTFGTDFERRRVATIENPLNQWYLLEGKFVTKNITAGILTLKDTYAYINNLKDSVKIWFDMLNPQQSEFSAEEKIWLEKLSRLGFVSLNEVPEIVLYTYGKGGLKKSPVELLQAIEKAVFIRQFLGRNSRTAFLYYDLSVKKAGKLKYESQLPELIERRIKTLCQEPNMLIEDLTFGIGRRRKGYYQWEGIRYFLYEYELHLKEKSKTSREKLDWNLFCKEAEEDYTTIEHVFPQTDSVEYWRVRFNKYSDGEKEMLKNSLGNLVPLSRPKNSSLQNISFDDKKQKGDGTIGFNFGSFSENEIALYPEWTALEILYRGIKLFEFMETRWGVSLGERIDKVKMLQLYFVLKKEGIRAEDLDQLESKIRHKHI